MKVGEIHEAIKKGDLAKISDLVQSKPELLKSQSWWGRETLLHLAVKSGKADVVNLLLSKGADINAKDKSGKTPLDTVFWLEDSVAATMAELLLAKGANVAATDNSGVTPLHSAAIQKLPCLAEMLIKHGANVNAKTSSSATPLHAAAIRGSDSIAEQLLKAGAEVNAKGTIGKFANCTPLCMAIKMSGSSDAGNSYNAVIELLKRHGGE